MKPYIPANYTEKLENFRKKLLSGHMLGCFSKSTDSSVIEAIGYSGMDYVVLDMEHSPMTTESVKTHLMALGMTPTLGIVRVERFDSMHIGKALDLGAHGIMVTSVQNAEQASTAMQLAKFHPSGERGLCRFVRAGNYGEMPKNDYFTEANRSLMVLQLEGKEALENFEEIIGVEGIDVIFIGPYDLSQSLGIPGDIENPKITEAVDGMIARANERNVRLGIFTDTPQQLRHWRDRGIAFLAYSNDISILIEALKKLRHDLDGK